MPGGDNIGSRQLDMHFRGLTAMGVEIHVVHGFIEARAKRLTGTRVVLDFPSNGATENLLTAAVLAKGTTVIENAAREPEIVELAAMLNRMGAQVIGAGTPTIEIVGVDDLMPVDCELIGDRIEAGTLLMACGIAGGEITIDGARLDHVEIVASKLGEMGLKVVRRPPRAESGRAPRSAHGRRRRHAAVPGVRHRLHAPRGRAARDGRRHRRSSPRTCSTTARFRGDELNRMGADIRTEGVTR